MGMSGIRCQVWSWKVRGGGGRIFGRGVREKGGSDEPPNPPWLRACHMCSQHFVSYDFVNNVEYQMGHSKKREDQQDCCPDNFSIETV